MLNELYKYAYPNLTEQQKSRWNELLLIFGVTFMSIIAIVIKINLFCTVVTVSYLCLSLLSLIDKDDVSRHMKIVVLSVLNLYIVSIYFFLKILPGYESVIWNIFLGIILFVIYEILFFIKIKKGLYTDPKKSKDSNLVIGISSVVLFSAMFYLIISKIILLKIAIMIIVYSGLFVLCLVFLQKLIIYLFVRNKITYGTIDKHKSTKE